MLSCRTQRVQITVLWVKPITLRKGWLPVSFDVTSIGFYKFKYNTQVKTIMEIITNIIAATVGYMSATTNKHPKKVKTVIVIPKHLISLFQSIVI